MSQPTTRLALLLAALLFGPLAQAQTPPPSPEGGKAETPAPEALTETHHTWSAGGHALRYRALAGDLLIGPEGKPKARMFYVAYLAEGAGRDRPLTFLFNGGPGSSSVWLHLGAFGPARVPVDAEGIPAPQPWAAVPNPDSLLDLSDLVFIDPVSTGYSRALPGQEEKPFHEFRADVESIGEMIRLFVTRQERWGAPLFLAGESYGTVRAAGLADYLERRLGISVSGVILLSPALNMLTLGGQPGNDLPFVLGLPSLTAAAWYHKKLAPELQADLARAYRESEELALGPYSRALQRGAALSAEERGQTIAQLARYTGLPADEIDRADLRVDALTFITRLLRQENRTIGLLDARYWGPPSSMAPSGAAPDYSYATVDPSYQVSGVFTATMNRYLREELKARSDLPYEMLAETVAASWDHGSGNLYSADNLRVAMTVNPRLKVFVASGRYDLVTTSLAARYDIDHLGLIPELRPNVSFHLYEGGHMMYMSQPSLDKLKGDLTAFYAAAAPRRETRAK
jgi:carboxypeptidase C (cathepsin A)